MAKYVHVFMLILVLHVLESAFANKYSSLSHADECSLLFQFKETMSINKSASFISGYPKVASWNLNTSDCCLWDGVECRFGHVIGLDLSNSFLYGHIYSNNSLFNLIHLRSLNLADNNFRYSQIPSGIGRLSQLSNLNLSDSRFSGEVPKQISQLRNLVSLDLRSNLLTMQSSDFQNLVQNSSETLRELFLSGVEIDSELPASIGNLTHLNRLGLGDCAFIGTLPTSISNLTQLTYLDLSVNKFTGSLPSLESFSNLTYLYLSENSSDRWKLPDWFGKLNKITHLDLSSCALTGTLPASLSNLTQLTYLDLSFNKFTGSLPSLESFSNLTYLSLSENSFDRWKLPDWFGKLKKITYLYLDYVNLYGEIPSSFRNFQNLELISFVDNSVTVDFSLFLSLKKLKFLYLSGNNITLPVIVSQTNETQPQFKELGLVSCNMKAFPEFLQFQHQLWYLYLDDNSIEGRIPGWMWNVSTETLMELSLSHNHLTGFEQHSPVAPWVSFIKRLDLSYNKLTGEIPASICDLMSLRLLDLSFNNITGSIPPCLSKLSNSLEVLNLRRNTLQGTIPNIFTNKSKLWMVNLSENKLEGRVPRSLENCESLHILDLGYNFIEDMFPFWLGTLSKLRVLILRFNKFHGTIRIPDKLKVNFPKLCIIDLSHNSFSGDLPYWYFQKWSTMQETEVDSKYIEDYNFVGNMSSFYWYSIQMTNKGVKMEYGEIMNIFYAVDLSCNMFRGKIPESIKTLTGLQMLNLSNNEFSGVIPSSIGNLIHLEALDLSSNKLFGMIPQDLVQLNFLEFLNVSNNNLTGLIPQGKQFNTFLNDSYIGNQALCGFPLSMQCGDSKPPNVSFKEDNDESDFPNGIDWAVILIGAVSGLMVGLICGNHLTIRYYKWFH